MQNLKITIIQTHLIWEDTAANLNHFESKFFQEFTPGETDLIVLPEMFDTGFSMNSEKLAEPMNNHTIDWMTSWAAKLDCEIMGSKIISENNSFFNRLLVVSKNGVKCFYDKKHLFRMAHENEHFTAGNQRIIHEIKGWKILLQICYDLRFPVFSRNRLIQNKPEYDVVVYVANWPERRRFAWQTLLKARAIENQVFCIGVNRVGADGNDVNYSGDSEVIDPWGNILSTVETSSSSCETIVLSYDVLHKIRETFPALKDADDFNLQINQP